jgi:hypothetical protein
MNETHTNRLFEALELELAWIGPPAAANVPPVKWLDPTLPAEVLSPGSRWPHFQITY